MKGFNRFFLFIFLGITPAVRAADQKSVSAHVETSSFNSHSFSWAASSSPITVRLITKRLKIVESQINTFSAHFDQTIKIKDAGITQEVVGST